MSPPVFDLAQVRLDNALLLFDEFVRQTARHADAATLRGLERRFAERVQIQPSYWSQIKSRSRQIGERLARQFEHLCHKPRGWMDEAHPGDTQRTDQVGATGADDRQPRDDDERFIVGLVLTYYRRHPQRARTRLLDLLGEVLVPMEATAPVVANTSPAASGGAGGAPVTAPGQRSASQAQGAPQKPGDDRELWIRTSSGVSPLKHKR